MADAETDTFALRSRAALRALRDRALARPILAAVAATALVSALALAFPGIDIALARVFHAPGVSPKTEFPLENVWAFAALRRSGMAVTRWAVILLLLGVLAKIFVPMIARALPTRKLLFLVASLAAGPGLLVNAFFKEVWGRPRPSETTLFGGDWTFLPAWIPGGACPTNCSFPSGEASGAAWLMALVFVVPESWRRATLAAVAAWMVVISANRIAFGSHFLSDVVIGWGLMLVVVLICREMILLRLDEATLARLDAALEAIGRRLTDPFRPRL